MEDGIGAVEDVPVLVISGPSGSGKSTIVNRLIAESPISLRKCISATTRPPRPGEVDGEDYYFLSAEEFERRRQQGEFLECEQVHSAGFWYGTLLSELARSRDQGAVAVLEIDVHGAMKVRNRLRNVLTIFIRTPSDAEYADRLKLRNTETPEAIRRRLQTAADELKWADQYDRQIVNDDLDRAVREITEVVEEWGGKARA